MERAEVRGVENLSLASEKRSVKQRANMPIRNIVLSLAVHLAILLLLLSPSPLPLQLEKEEWTCLEFAIQEIIEPVYKVEAQPEPTRPFSEKKLVVRSGSLPPPPPDVIPLRKVVREKKIPVRPKPEANTKAMSPKAGEALPLLIEAKSLGLAAKIQTSSTRNTAEPVVRSQITVVSDNARGADERQRYLAMVRQTIESHKRYPQRATMRHLQGRVGVRFLMARDGCLKQLEIPPSCMPMISSFLKVGGSWRQKQGLTHGMRNLSKRYMA